MLRFFNLPLSLRNRRVESSTAPLPQHASMAIILFLFLGVVLYFLFSWLRFRCKYDLHKIPSPPGLPLLGHTLEFSNGLASHQLAVWVGRSLKQLGFPKLMRVRGKLSKPGDLNKAD